MKVLVPVAGILFGAGVCCCGDFSEEFKKGFEEEFEKEMQKAIEDAGEPSTGTTTSGTTTTSSGSTASAGGLELVAGTCGRFKDMGVQGPSGFSILTCSDTGGSAALTLQGGGDHVAHCKALKTWSADKGYSLVVENDSGDTYSIVTRKSGENFVINCMKQPSGVWIAYSVSPGM